MRLTVGTKPYLFNVPDPDEIGDPPADLEVFAVQLNTYLRSLDNRNPPSQMVAIGTAAVVFTNGNGEIRTGVQSAGAICNAKSAGAPTDLVQTHWVGTVWGVILMRAITNTGTPFTGTLTVQYVAWE